MRLEEGDPVEGGGPVTIEVFSRVCWVSVKDRLPLPSPGYDRYLVVLNPRNHADFSDMEPAMNGWRNRFGIHVAMYDTYGHRKWRIDGEGRVPFNEDVTDRVTHWAELPAVPQL